MSETLDSAVKSWFLFSCPRTHRRAHSESVQHHFLQEASMLSFCLCPGNKQYRHVLPPETEQRKNKVVQLVCIQYCPVSLLTTCGQPFQRFLSFLSFANKVVCFMRRSGMPYLDQEDETGIRCHQTGGSHKHNCKDCQIYLSHLARDAHE